VVNSASQDASRNALTATLLIVITNSSLATHVDSVNRHYVESCGRINWKKEKGKRKERKRCKPRIRIYTNRWWKTSSLNSHTLNVPNAALATTGLTSTQTFLFPPAHPRYIPSGHSTTLGVNSASQDKSSNALTAISVDAVVTNSLLLPPHPPSSSSSFGAKRPSL
jgi:hypothetical protein